MVRLDKFEKRCFKAKNRVPNISITPSGNNGDIRLIG